MRIWGMTNVISESELYGGPSLAILARCGARIDAALGCVFSVN